MRKTKIYAYFSAIFVVLNILLGSFRSFALSEVLVKYDFSDIETGTKPSYVSGDAVISANGEWLDAFNKKAVFSAPRDAENVSLLADIRSNEYVLIKLYDGEIYQQINFKPDTVEWESLLIDLKDGNLTVLCGSRQVMVKGSLEISRIEKVEILNAEIDNVSLGEQTLPSRITDLSIYYNAPGKSLAASYIYYSPDGQTETPTYTWYVSDSLSGTYQNVKSSIQNGVANPGEDKYIYLTISYSGGTVSTEPRKVSDSDVMVFNEAKSLQGGAEITFVYKDDDGKRHWSPQFSDWSDYDEIVFRIKSTRSTDRFYQVYIASDDPNYGSNDYYNTFFKVDWGGNTVRKLSFKIGEDEGLETSGHPTGWDYISSVAFYTNLTKTQSEDGGAFTALESNPQTQTDLWIYSVYLRKSKSACEEILWEKDYILNDHKKQNKLSFAENIMQKAHPRLLLTEAKIAQLKEDVITDEYLKKSYERLQSTVAGYINGGPLTEASSATSGYIAAAAMLYNLKPDTELKEWIWTSCENLSKNVTTWNPDSRSFLSVGDTMRAMALTYDWMYNHFTEGERRIVRNAIMLHGFRAMLPKMRTETNWSVGGGNWCQSLLSGAGVGALAICDNDAYRDICNEVLDRTVFGLGYGMEDFESNGSYLEGTAYWQYAMDCFSTFEAALSAVCGSNYGLMDGEGMPLTGYFPIMMTGMRGTFNFSDATNVSSTISHSYYRLSEYFNNPAFGNYQYQYTKNSGGNYLSMILYDTNGYGNYIDYMPNYQYFSGPTESFVMRSDYEKGSDGMYLGFKGGDNTIGHGQLDAGSFVYDYKGVRFFWDMGRDSYSYNSKWELYRNRAEGNNCLVINPDTNPDQDPTGYSKVEEYRVTDKAGYAIINMTDAYDTAGATEVKRGFMMLDNFNTLVIRDEIKAETVSELYSFLHTGATISYAQDRQSAVLTIGGVSLNVYLLSNCGATLSDMRAELLKLPEKDYAFSNAGTRKLMVKAENAENPTIALVITPYELESVDVAKLSEWKNEYFKLTVENEEIKINDEVVLSPFEVNREIKTVSARYMISNETKEKTNVWLLLASYLGGKLIDLEIINQEVKSEESKPIFADIQNMAGENAEIKVFLWTDGLNPIINDSITVKKTVITQ